VDDIIQAVAYFPFAHLLYNFMNIVLINFFQGQSKISAFFKIEMQNYYNTS